MSDEKLSFFFSEFATNNSGNMIISVFGAAMLVHKDTISALPSPSDCEQRVMILSQRKKRTDGIKERWMK